MLKNQKVSIKKCELVSEGDVRRLGDLSGCESFSETMS